ncbi:hypothetical protein B7H23_00300 [Notoacmeibacter marinus]|uniref:Uncharacterized protein n=1 Tax=Notoacmeibacter marinus TaxID=1876515 RepID=A0A231V024_9HYPH|nr:hypothetical protein B7H23_00300 [Notoacmeibacter marinus]
MPIAPSLLTLLQMTDPPPLHYRLALSVYKTVSTLVCLDDWRADGRQQFQVCAERTIVLEAADQTGSCPPAAIALGDPHTKKAGALRTGP